MLFIYSDLVKAHLQSSGCSEVNRTEKKREKNMVVNSRVQVALLGGICIKLSKNAFVYYWQN